jgi:hypothetical protein
MTRIWTSLSLIIFSIVYPAVLGTYIYKFIDHLANRTIQQPFSVVVGLTAFLILYFAFSWKDHTTGVKHIYEQKTAGFMLLFVIVEVIAIYLVLESILPNPTGSPLVTDWTEVFGWLCLVFALPLLSRSIRSTGFFYHVFTHWEKRAKDAEFFPSLCLDMLAIIALLVCALGLPWPQGFSTVQRFFSPGLTIWYLWILLSGYIACASFLRPIVLTGIAAGVSDLEARVSDIEKRLPKNDP